MNQPHAAYTDISLWAFLDELKSCLRAASDDQKALTLSLRRTCEHFKIDDGCIAILTPDGSQAD